MKVAITLASLAIAAAAPAFGVVTYQSNVNTIDSVDNDFISGNGNQINNFVKDTAVSGLSVAIKPRNRDISFGGQPNSVVNDRYVVTPGQSLNNPARPQLVFDYQFDPGVDLVTNFQVQIDLDYDPAVGAATFYTLKQPIHAAGANNSWDDTDGYFTTNGTNNAGAPTNHAWNNGLVPYVISNTTNLAFNPQFSSPAGLAFPYNSSAFGEYEVRLTAFDDTGTIQLAQVTAFVVVPEPTSLAALAGASVLGLRRRRA
jgi:hypothetical protein